MAVEIIITAEAEADIAGAYAWYEGQRSGLGEEFLSSVDACIQRILRFPEMYAMVQSGYRRGLVRKFPYAIFYEHHQGVVAIHAVFHTAREPAKWRQRLP